MYPIGSETVRYVFSDLTLLGLGMRLRARRCALRGYASRQSVSAVAPRGVLDLGRVLAVMTDV